MALVERRDTDGQAGKACIVCKAFQPRDGKFLSCMHIICAGCLNECKNRDGSISCSICNSSTTAQAAGVEFSKQLADSAPFLNVEPVTASDSAWAGVGSGQSLDIALCDPCNDNDIERNASHQCDDCDLPLCSSHAEKHLKKRAYSGHRVCSRPGNTRRPPRVSKCCMYHSQCDVVTYCRSCCQCICAECIAAGNHEGHSVESLASAADKQRARVAKIFQTTGLGNGRSPGVLNITHAYENYRMGAEDLLEEVQKNIAIATNEAGAASKTTAERFNEIDKIVKRERERAQNEIDHRLWKQLDPLEAKKQRLESLLQRQATVVEVTTNLLSPNSVNEGVLQVADTVADNLLHVATGLQAEREVALPSLVIVESAPLDEIRNVLQRTARVRDGVRVDISKSSLDPQQPNLYAGCAGRVVVNLADSRGKRIPSDQPIPDILAFVIFQDGSRQAAKVSAAESASSKLVIPVSHTKAGNHTLVLTYNGVSCRLTLPVFPGVHSGVSFDPRKCHEKIKLSDNNCRSTVVEDKEPYFNVLATDGYTSGCHEWSIRVVTGSVAIAGVTSVPPGGDYSSSVPFFSGPEQYQCGWYCGGSAFVVRGGEMDEANVGEPTKMRKIQEGDELLFLLDCNAQSLQCVNQRTKEARKIMNINCPKPLYPAVCFDAGENSVDIRNSYP